MDECVKGTHQCDGDQVCTNRQGGYVCNCPQGFRLNAQRQCQDINECESYYGRVSMTVFVFLSDKIITESAFSWFELVDVCIFINEAFH